MLVVARMIADFDLGYLVPAVPAACLAAALAFAPRPGEPAQRKWTTSAAATATSEPGETRTSSLPSGATPTAGPESAGPPGRSAPARAPRRARPGRGPRR